MKKKEFNALKGSYGLKTPRQIKERILWEHIKLLVLDAYPGSEQAIKQYDHQWKLLEEVENKKGAN